MVILPPKNSQTAAPAATGFDSGDNLDLPVAQLSPHYDSDDFDLPAAQPSPRHAGMLDKVPSGSSAAVGSVYVGKIVPAIRTDQSHPKDPPKDPLQVFAV